MGYEGKENRWDINMSSEVPQCDSIYLKFQTRPKINKHKVKDFVQRGWEISSSDFDEKNLVKKKTPIFLSNRTNLLNKMATSFNEQEFNQRIENKIKNRKITNCLTVNNFQIEEQNTKDHYFPSNISVQEEILDENTFYNVKKGKEFNTSENRININTTEVFFKKVSKSIKRKSMSETTNTTNDFSYFHERLTFCPTDRANYIFSTIEKQQTIFPKKKNDFSIHDIQASFHNTKSCYNSTNLSSSDFKVQFRTKLKKSNFLEKEQQRNKTVADNCLNFQKPDFSDFVTKIPIVEVSKNNLSDLKVPFPVPAFESLASLYVLQLEKEQEEIKCESPQSKDSLFSKNINLLHTLDFKKVVSENGSSSRGSNWMQSLQWSPDEHSHSEGKKKMRNILPGGYADQMLKLQRRELFDKAISEHKIESNKSIDSMSITILSILSMDEIIVAKCIVSPDSFPDRKSDSDLQLKEVRKDFVSKDSGNLDTNDMDNYNLIMKTPCLVLFQKHVFCKQQMKHGHSFLLFQPWHFLQIKSLQYPVIFCTHFKTITVNDEQPNEMHTQMKSNDKTEECHTVLKDISQTKENLSNTCIEADLFFYKWRTNINLDVRIQRIWTHAFILKKNCDILNQACNRLSLLLQSENGIFYELIFLSSDAFHIDWLKHIWNAEGKCFHLCNLKTVHRLQYKRSPKLFNYLQTLLKRSADDKLNQEFIYQLVVDNVSKLPCEIVEHNFPLHLSVNFEALVLLLQEEFSDSERFSCIGKILFQYKNVLYLSDNSIFHSEVIQYIKVKLPKEEQFISGSQISIKEAIAHEGWLLLDEYSQLSILQKEHNELTDLDFCNLKISLNINSKISDIVFIKGEINYVDENEAYTWLQCSFCFKENLVEDIKGIIYCQDCSLIVNKPVLSVKMTITLVSEELSNVLLNVQLLSSTIKQLLQLSENSCNPQCTVTDVLGKKIESLLCYIRGEEILGDKKIFYLTEINLP